MKFDLATRLKQTDCFFVNIFALYLPEQLSNYLESRLQSIINIETTPMQAIRSYIERVRIRLQEEPCSSCTSCLEETPARKILITPCGHQYCPPCLRQMSQVSLENPDLFPTKCCREEIPMEEVLSVMSTRNKKRYMSRKTEGAVPPELRMYCPRKTCGQWIHPESKGPQPGTQLCTHCGAQVCCGCRELAHGPWPCADDESLKTVLAMAKENKWQRCTKCHYMVEKVDGCNHISCRCGHHFCYICGGRQNRCKCPTEDTTEDLAADGNLDVRTLVTAMQQADIQDRRP